jgi:NitT/TauT family transport system permease protein
LPMQRLPSTSGKAQMKVSDLFELRGELDQRTSMSVSALGFLLLLVVWQAIPTLGLIPQSLLPTPTTVLASFKELHFEDYLVRNCLYSLRLNMLGYVEAIAIALPIGFIVGLFPLFRSMAEFMMKASRFVPLAAATGLFISWFGIGDNMKVQFLAVSIIVYLLPVVVQRIDDVENVYLQTAFTLGANKWQTITSVFLPAVLSRVWKDISVLVAISWTYITIAEALNMTGGVGALAVQSARQSRVDKVFAVLFVIILIGVIQDKLFSWLDRVMFPFKYK